MTALVLYYSNTGNTQKVAKGLAEQLGADLAEITCQTYLTWYGPLAMAWDIFSRRRPKVSVVVPAHAHYDLVVIGGPVWAAHAAPPVLKALQLLPATEAAAAFVTCRGNSSTSPPGPALAEMQSAIAAPVVASRIFREEEIRGPSLVGGIAEFAAALTSKAPA